MNFVCKRIMTVGLFRCFCSRERAALISLASPQLSRSLSNAAARKVTLANTSGYPMFSFCQLRSQCCLSEDTRVFAVRLHALPTYKLL